MARALSFAARLEPPPSPRALRRGALIAAAVALLSFAVGLLR